MSSSSTASSFQDPQGEFKEISRLGQGVLRLVGRSWGWFIHNSCTGVQPRHDHNGESCDTMIVHVDLNPEVFEALPCERQKGYDILPFLPLTCRPD